jgi:hypothetical protein
MDRLRIPRQLRIAFSVVCVIVCLMLIVLWLRSYWRLEILEKQIGLRAVQISSVKGRIAIAHFEPRTYVIGMPYLNVGAGDAADWRKGRVAYYDDGSVTALIVPHWLLAILSATLAVIPWISRSYRFSLRTLLLATTLVGVVLGLAVTFG